MAVVGFLRLAPLEHGAAAPAAQPVFKADCEMGFWRKVAEKEPTMHNDHYLNYFTMAWDFTVEWYEGKHLLDIGCGPRGSLELLTSAASRTCAEPLAKQYGREFGIGKKHSMRYVACGVESMPFPDQSFDVVSSINNFDHVENVDKGIAEIFRVLRTGGSLLMMVEIHSDYRPCEPQSMPANLADLFKQKGMEIQKLWITANRRGPEWGTRSVLGEHLDPQNPPNEDYWLCFQAVKQ